MSVCVCAREHVRLMSALEPGVVSQPCHYMPVHYQMTEKTTLMTKQHEIGDFLALVQNCQSETSKNHSKPAGLSFQKNPSVYMNEFYERTQRSLYLAQGQAVERETHWKVKMVAFILPSSPSAWSRYSALMAEMKQSQKKCSKNQCCQLLC